MNDRVLYSADIVLCIDCTNSMKHIIEEVKSRALSFQSALEEKMKLKQKHIDPLRVRAIGFRDFFVDDEPIVAMTDFVDLRKEGEVFESFVRGLSAVGGGDEPENGLEALALAMQSNWYTAGTKGRRIIVMFTDASAHTLEKGAAASPDGYPRDMPKSLVALTAMWEAQPRDSRRLLLYAPEVQPWTQIGDSWNQTIFFPSVAGAGLEDQDFDAILETIANSVGQD